MIRLAPIPRGQVISAWIRAIGYDPTAKVLVIDTVDGRSVFYGDVPPEVAHDVQFARESHGKAFNRLVRGRYATIEALEVPMGRCPSCHATGLEGTACEACEGYLFSERVPFVDVDSRI